MIDGLKIHVDRVMETIKARKESEVRTHIDQALRTATQRSAPDWDAESEHDELFQVEVASQPPDATQAVEIMKETIDSLQAAQERMELRARATAALQAAANRAAASEPQDRNGGANTRPISQAITQKNPAQTASKTPPVANETSTAILQEKFQKAVEDAQIRQAAEALQQAQTQQASPTDWAPMQDLLQGAGALQTEQPQQANSLDWQHSHLQPASSPEWQQDALHSATSFTHHPTHEASAGFQVAHGQGSPEWQHTTLQTVSSFPKGSTSQAVQVPGGFPPAATQTPSNPPEWQHHAANSTEWQQMQVLGGYQAGTLEWGPSQMQQTPPFTHVLAQQVQTQTAQAESIQDRIKRIMVEAQIRSSKNIGLAEAAEELTNSGSSYSATDSTESSSDSGAEVPVRWAAAPPPPGYWHPRPR